MMDYMRRPKASVNTINTQGQTSLKAIIKINTQSQISMDYTWNCFA